MSRHTGTFEEIMANTGRGQTSERQNPDGSVETVVGPMPSEEIDGGTISPQFEGVQFKFWTSEEPAIEGVAMTYEGRSAFDVGLESGKVFDSVEEAKEWIASQAAK